MNLRELSVRRDIGFAFRLALGILPVVTTLLQQRDAKRREARLLLWDETRRTLQTALRELSPGTRVFVYGSLAKRGVFNSASDIDLALTEEPRDKTIWLLQAELEERLRRPIDLVLLSETRLRDKILRDGEEWTTSN